MLVARRQSFPEVSIILPVTVFMLIQVYNDYQTCVCISPPQTSLRAHIEPNVIAVIFNLACVRFVVQAKPNTYAD